MTNVLLATSNGVGMGHLTRQAAIALALQPQHQATLFSLSLGLPVATGLGIPGEYCPSYDQPWIASRDWHAYLRDRLVAIVEETKSEAVLFDGVAPYPGIGLAASELREVAFVWLRRGMWQPNTNVAQLRKRRFFDLVIEPGDIAQSADRGPTADLHDAVNVGPISILEAVETMPRDAAREHLGLPLDRPIALLTLGSGRLGDVVGPGQIALDTLLREASEWHIAVTRSPVALNEIPTDEASRISVLQDVYPLARYLAAFDLAVSSAGYNAVHELIPARIPTLFVANTSTRTDDQIARADELARLGLALGARDDETEAVANDLRRLVEDSVRADITKKMNELPAPTGASDTGRALTGFAEQFGVRRLSVSDRLDAAVFQVKEASKRLLGDEGTARVKKWLGREPQPTYQRTEVAVTDTSAPATDGDPIPLALLESVSTADLRSQSPIEHLLPGSSTKYQMRRRALVDAYYDVRG